MRTTVDLPDALFRKAKVRAAQEGRPLKELIADGLKLVLQRGKNQPPAALPRTEFPIIKPADPARNVTPEMVGAAEKHLLEGEAAAHGRFTGH